jgi:hypothetical protein
MKKLQTSMAILPTSTRNMQVKCRHHKHFMQKKRYQRKSYVRYKTPYQKESDMADKKNKFKYERYATSIPSRTGYIKCCLN